VLVGVEVGYDKNIEKNSIAYLFGEVLRGKDNQACM